MNPHSNLGILGVSPYLNWDDSNEIRRSMSFWGKYFSPRPFISTRYRDINFLGFFRFSPILTLGTLQAIQTSITSVFIEISRSYFSRTCTLTVTDISQNCNFLGSWIGGKLGVRKRIILKKIFFPCNFSASFLTLFCRHLECNMIAQTRRSYLTSFPRYGVPKICAKIILTVVSENFVNRFWKIFSVTIVFTLCYQERK
jgi:hypothetical protein